mgnify:CR=1 FL=1
MVVVPPSRHTRKRAPLLFWRERWMVAFVFAAVLLVGLIATACATTCEARHQLIELPGSG